MMDHRKPNYAAPIDALCPPVEEAKHAVQLLTHSRQDAFKVCRRKHWFAYEIGLRKTVDAKALRMGSAYHAAIEQLNTATLPETALEQAVDTVRAVYDNCPEMIEPLEWAYECETVIRLACGYQWRWADDRMEHVVSEQSFCLPLLTPATGRPTPNCQLAGVIDGIERLEDGRLACREAKLFGEDLGPDAPFWRRLRIDHQLSIYLIAARQLGHEVATVLYDVTRKPTIAPTSVPILDDDGMKVVLDQNGMRVFTKQNKPRQTGDVKQGWVLQSRPMTTEEWGDKLTGDIVHRPDYYYARAEVARLDSELDECRQELWEVQQAIREAQRAGRWYRTCNRNTCSFCAYFDLCTCGYNPKIDPLPDGFEVVQDVHPELGDRHARTPAGQASTAPAD